jgi:hypothetical protein
MLRGKRVLMMLILSSVALPVAVVHAAVSRPARSGDTEAGICTEAGCKGGDDKCAEGTLTTPSGGTATYTCLTTKAET